MALAILPPWPPIQVGIHESCDVPWEREYAPVLWRYEAGEIGVRSARRSWLDQAVRGQCGDLAYDAESRHGVRVAGAARAEGAGGGPRLTFGI